MLLILCFLILFVVFLVSYFRSPEEHFGIFIGTFCFGLVFLTVSFAALLKQASAEKEYKDFINESYSIYYRIEHAEPDEKLIEDISTFNYKIMKNRKFVDNAFVGVFYNRKIANMDTIKLDFSSTKLG